jgi:hypothetical protein
MAVVRFSEELKNAVIENAKGLFSKRISETYKASPPIAEEVADMVFAQFMPHINALPKDFIQWTKRVELRVPYNNSTVEVSYETSREFPKPNHRVKIEDGVVIDSMYSVTLRLPDTPKYQNYINQIGAWRDSITALETQCDVFVTGVRKVVNAHATLAPALKSWPPLWDLVPDTFKERHRKIVERSKPEAADLDIDLTSLTTTVVAAKIAGK